MEAKKTPELRRRKLLGTLAAGTALGVGGLGAFTGTATAWEKKEVYFKGCSEVWLVVGAGDTAHDPPAVVRVVVALADGTTDCRDIELTAESTTTIPGQHGADSVRKVEVEDGEKVLGVVFYNYNEDPQERFSSASCIDTNDNRCAQTPNTPSLEDADCVQAARDGDGYDCPTESSKNAGQTPGRKAKSFSLMESVLAWSRPFR